MFSIKPAHATNTRAPDRRAPNMLVVFLRGRRNPMFRPPFLKLPLIALSVALAACVQEPPPAPHLSGAYAYTPVAITCDVPGPKPRTILVPAGRNPTDFCPATAITYHTPYYPPVVNGPPPAAAAAIEMQLNKDAQTPLDAIAAAKLQNKTPGQPP
jgi:hypothetical protein